MANKWIPVRPQFAFAYEAVDCLEQYNTRRGTDGTTSGQLPQRFVSLEIPYAKREYAKQRLLAGPEYWPYADILNPFYCVSVNERLDGGAYTKLEEELLTTTNVIFDCVYTYRPGKYRKFPYYIVGELGGKIYVEDHVEPRTELFPQDPRLFNWVTDGKAIGPDQSPVLPVNGDTIVHTVHGLVTYNQQWSSWIGKTNSNSYVGAFTDNLIDFPPGSLLLRTINTQLEVCNTTYLLQESTFALICRFEYRDIGLTEPWNRFYRPYSGSPTTTMWDKMKYKDSATEFKPAQLQDMSEILFDEPAIW